MMPFSRLAALFCLALVCAGLSTSVAVDVRSRVLDASVLMARAAPANTTAPPKPQVAAKPAPSTHNTTHNATRPVPKPKLVRSGRPATAPERNPVYFNGRLQTKAMRCLNLTVREGGYCLVVNKLEAKRRVNTTQLNSMILTSDFVTINTLKSWPDERIKLQGNIQVNGNVIFGLPPTSPPKDNIGKLIASVGKPLGTAFIEEMLVVSHHRSPSGRPEGSDRSRHAITHDRRVHAQDDSDEFDPISRDRDHYAPEPESDSQRRYMRQWKLVEHDDFEADLSSLDEQEEDQDAVPDGRNLYHGGSRSRLRDAEDQEDEREEDDGQFDRDTSREEKRNAEDRWERARDTAELEAQRSNLAGWYWNDGTSALQNRSHCGTKFMHARHPADSESGANAEDILTPATITVSKVFERLPEHSQLSLQAQVHFIDEWRGAVMFAMIDGEHVWLDSHESIQSEMKYFGGDERDKPTEQFDRDAFTHPNLCGGSHPWDRLAVPIRVVVPHRARSANITFGCSSLLPGSSFGIDDVSLLVR